MTTGGLIYHFDANADQVLDDGWESSLNPGEVEWQFSADTRVSAGNEGTTQTNSILGDLHGISGRLNFPRTNNDVNSTRDRASALDYTGFNDSAADASWEFWIKFENVGENQVIWETGGSGTGSSFTISAAGELQWVIKNNSITDSVTQAVLADGEYHHVVGVYDRDDAASTIAGEDTMTLYIDGVQVATTRDNGAPTTLHNWDGGDDASLGGRVSTVGGHLGDLGSIDGYRNLDGKIATHRFYSTALTSADVTANIAAVQAETIYFDDGFGTIGPDILWRNEANWDTNSVSSQNQNVVINADQTAEIDANTVARVQTLYIGNDGASSIPGYVTDGTAPADGNGTLRMTGGTLVATQIVLGAGADVGTFDFVDGTINVSKDADADFDNGSNDQAFHIGLSNSGTTETSIFTMGSADGSTSPLLNVSGGRFEIGENGLAANGTRVNATFEMLSGTFNLNGQNFILGQGNIADASQVTFNMEGGTVNIGADLNINDGTARLTQNGGFISARDLQTQNTGAATDIIQLNGGIFEVRDDLNDRGGTSTLNIAGGRLELDAVNPATREVENINFSSGIIEFSIADSAQGFKALTVGTDVDPNGVGVFTGSGQIEVELDNIATGTATSTTTTWSGSGEWTTTNTAEWSVDNPIQYITSGTAYDLILPNNAATSMTDLGNLTAVGSDWTLSTFTTFNADDSLRITAANDVGLTPIKAVIDAAGETITRNSNLQISAEAGGDAAELDVIDGTLDLSTSGSDLQIGGEAVAVVNQSGGSISVNNLIFGGGEGTGGGTLSLTGGTFNVDGVIIEGALGSPFSSVNNAQLQIDGGTLTVGGDQITVQRFAVGDSLGTTGVYSATGQTIESTGTTAIGSSGNGTYTTENTTHTAATFTIGETANGVGVFNQNGGTVTVAGDFFAGQNGDGTYTLDQNSGLGDGTLEVGREFIVGSAGTGTANILAGTVNILGAGLDVASGAGSTGNFTLGSSAGVLNPVVNVSGGNFETANLGTGNVNLLSGEVVLVTNNLITGQAATSVANVTMGGGQGKFVLNSSVSNDWNTNDGQGNVDVLKNATLNIGRSLNLGTGGALDLDLNGGAINIGVNNTGGDLDYRGGTGTGDIIKVTDALLTVADDFIFDDGSGKFQVNGSGSQISVGDAYTQTAGNELIAALDPLGVTAIQVGGNVALAGTLNIDETNIASVAPNSASTLGTAGAWDGTGTNWDKGNPSAVGITTGDRIVVIEYAGALTDTGFALDAGDTANWTLDTATANEIAVIAQTDFGTAPVHAILDSDGTTTRTADLTIDASGAAADAAGLTVTASDTLNLGGNSLTVQGGATLAGEGTIAGGATTIASGAFLSSGATDTGLVGGGSTAGQLTFSGDLTLAAGSTWLVDLVDGSTADFIDVSSNALTITDANLVFGGFTPAKFTTYSIASYSSLSGTFAGLADGAEINGFEINYGTKAGFANQITLTAVPEPAAIIPMILGALVGGFFLRRKRKAAA